MSETNSINKRRYTRYNVTVLGQMRALNDQEWRRVQVVTLSTNGACAIVGRNKFSSDLVEFKMASAGPDRPSYNLIAKIVWVNDDRVGLEFVSGG